MTRPEIMAALARIMGKADAKHWLLERASIREHDGEQTRADAEAGAWDDAKRLIRRSRDHA